MERTLYLECNSGISGDMTVAALLDLGADEEKLREAVSSLPIDGFQVEISRVKKAGLYACDFCVKLDADHENHDHDMEYLHGHEHHHGGHHHGGHHHEHHHHEHRGLPEIIKIIRDSGITERAKETAIRIFEILAEAESKAHGVPAEEVHFHEVGAVDSIVDIVAAAVCLDDLGIKDVIVPELCEGSGSIRCQHGIIPVPVPAVINIAEKHQLKLHFTELQGELVTPTGAAIVAAVKTSDRLPDRFTIEKTGMGAGKRNYERPSLLRAMLIRPEQKKEDTVYVLEANIDDCSGELLGHAMDELLRAGARDVHYTPVFMKKNRPAYLLRVICGREDAAEMERIMFRETTTIGIRRMEMKRTVLERRLEKRLTSLGEIVVKVCILPDGEERVYPEYERAAELAREHGISLRDVYDVVGGECRK